MGAAGDVSHFSKTEGIYIQKDAHYKITDSLEVKGRCQSDFHLLGISLRRIYNIAMKSGEADRVVK